VVGLEVTSNSLISFKQELVTLIFNVILIIYFALCDFNVMETLFIEVEKVNYSVRIFQNVEHNRQNRNRIIVMKETSNFEYILLDV